MKLTIGFAFFAILLEAMVIAIPTAARIIYADNKLATNCTSDSYSVQERNCNGSEGMAFKTIMEAVDAIRPGDTVLIRGGTYLDALKISRSGTPAAPITISSFANETVTINGAKRIPVEETGLISINKSAYLRLNGLKTVSSNYYGIYVSESSQIAINACEVSRSNHGGIVAIKSSNITIANCEVHHNNYIGASAKHEAISIEAVDIFEVKYCRVYKNKEEGIDAKYGSSRGRIHHNKVFANDGPNIYIDSASRIAVFANSVRGAARQGIGIAVESENNPFRFTTHHIRVFNNLIYGNGCGIWFWIEPEAVGFARFSQILLVNNVIVANNRKNWGAVFFQDGTALNYGNDLIIRNNIFWENTALEGARAIRDDIRVSGRWAIDHNLFRKGEPTDTFGQDAVLTEDVKFVNAPNYNFRLLPNSPAIDAGSAANAPAVDYDGNRRDATAVDIGAFEYSDAVEILNPPNSLLPLDEPIYPRPATPIRQTRLQRQDSFALSVGIQ
jgi:parallel beta-helix repeat protein